MRVLAIETSCDETGIAILEGAEKEGVFTFEILGNALLSQAALHAPYGGVFPSLAKREHEKNLPVMLEQACIEAAKNFSEKIVWPEGRSPRRPRGPKDFFSEKFLAALVSQLELDAIVVTHGPGLEPALWTGITFAQKLAKETATPLLGVNHMEGHLLSSLAQKGNSHILENVEITTREIRDVQFPVLGLLISGGHTEFVLMSDWFEYKIIGRTLDDAVGEAFDKVARLLGLPYPGGPEISKLADTARSSSVPALVSLPRPMLKSKNCDMSFSGLKTAALYALRGKTLNDAQKAAFAQEFEDTVGDVFVAKTRKALIETGAKTFVIGGGVAANRYLRERLQTLLLDEFDDVEFRLPELHITGDNAVMIAEAALVHLLREGIPTVDSEDIRAVGNLSLEK